MMNKIVATLVAFGIAIMLAAPTMGGAKNAWVAPGLPAAEDHDDPVDCLGTITAIGAPVAGSVPLDTEDVYCFVLLPTQNVHIEVDTTSAAGADDMWSCAGTSVNVVNCLATGDDDMPCTFPPPVFSCPSYNMGAQTTRVPPVYYVIVGVFIPFTPQGDYELSVTRAGTPVALHQVLEDRPAQGP